MSESWKYETDDNGDVWLDFGFWKLHCGDMEDLDKEHFEVIDLLARAPKLLELCEKAEKILPGATYIIDDKRGHSDMVEKLVDLMIELEKEIALAKNEIPFTDEVVSDETELGW